MIVTAFPIPAWLVYPPIRAQFYSAGQSKSTNLMVHLPGSQQVIGQHGYLEAPQDTACTFPLHLSLPQYGSWARPPSKEKTQHIWTLESEASTLAEPEYSPDWPTDLASDDESEEEETNLAFEDGMRSKAASDVDIDSDVEVEDEQDTFSLATEALDDEVLLEKLLSQSEKVGEDADDEEWVPSRVRYQRQWRKEERTGVCTAI
ncbi:hypothetical protein B0H14DRAFT_2631878 [Mycena olivaceomarginata]|nr:hypothetical protein B0H14DRAFT_2631878 [Mycena olivaceomarginata]